MSSQERDAGPLPRHGSRRLPNVKIDSYNFQIEDEEGFIGDRASKGSFTAILEKWRKRLRKLGDDPFGEKPSDEISKKELDSLLTEGDPEVAGVRASWRSSYAGS
jgi:hypothetical protein